MNKTKKYNELPIGEILNIETDEKPWGIDIVSIDFSCPYCGKRRRTKNISTGKGAVYQCCWRRNSNGKHSTHHYLRDTGRFYRDKKKFSGEGFFRLDDLTPLMKLAKRLKT